MRVLCLLLFALFALPARSENIVDVLTRSQTQRLAAHRIAAPDSDRAARVRASFAWLVAVTEQRQRVELIVVAGPLHAEALLGHVLVASESLADLPEGERLLLLAHELGHLRLGHWDQLCGLYRRHIPGEVRPETTDPVAGALGAEAHRQAHRHEYEADAFGYRTIRQLGYRFDTAISLFARLAVPHDTATHPATRRRAAQLRDQDEQFRRSTLQLAGSAWWHAEME